MIVARGLLLAALVTLLLYRFWHLDPEPLFPLADLCAAFLPLSFDGALRRTEPLGPTRAGAKALKSRFQNE
jgi:hypothetical protein